MFLYENRTEPKMITPTFYDILVKWPTTFFRHKKYQQKKLRLKSLEFGSVCRAKPKRFGLTTRLGPRALSLTTLQAQKPWVWLKH
jgi:hypothetical protein